MSHKKITPYHPPQEILRKYAQVLVNFALNSGKGMRSGETVRIRANESAKPLYAEIVRAVWQSGGNVIAQYIPEDEPYFKFDRTFYELASDKQIKYFPAKYMRGIVDDVDHLISIISQTDKTALKGIDSGKIMARGLAMKPVHEWCNTKENFGKFTWTVGMYGTPAMAESAGLSEKEYWKQIIQACYLNTPNPIAEWKKVYKKINKYIHRLNSLKIDRLHIKGVDVDLWITLGSHRKWVGGGGRNIPSFEIFTSPDWRGTNGWIRFNQPLYRYGNLIEGIRLEFKDGHVIKSEATKNHKVLRDMIATKDADKVGEFSLTDRRFSRITKFMAETLFDENMGGKFGNTHIALGSSYHDCYDGDPSKQKAKQWHDLGFNDSSVHTDIVSTSDRVVIAYFKDGRNKVIYRSGQFVL